MSFHLISAPDKKGWFKIRSCSLHHAYIQKAREFLRWLACCITHHVHELWKKKGDLFLYCLYCRLSASFRFFGYFEAFQSDFGRGKHFLLMAGFQMIATIATKKVEQSLRFWSLSSFHRLVSIWLCCGHRNDRLNVVSTWSQLSLNVFPSDCSDRSDHTETSLNFILL